MARDAEALKIRPWAVNQNNRADPEAVGIDRAFGWDVRYEQIGGQKPERLVFNQIIHELTVLFDAWNREGMLPWSPLIDYIWNSGGPISVVKGSDGNMYSSVAASGPSTGNIVDPVSDTQGNYWRRR